MSTLRPAYRLVVGDQVVDTVVEARTSGVIAIDVRLDLDTPADTAAITLGQIDGLDPRPGEALSVDLGYDDETRVRVLTGTVIALEPSLTSRRLIAQGGTAALLRTRVDRTFEDVSAGDIVRELASQAGVDIARVQAGPQLSAYVVDGRRPCASHVRDLAVLSGFEAYSTRDGSLVFERVAGDRTAHVLRYGSHVLDVEWETSGTPWGAVEVVGDSPGSSRGDESWAWLAKDPSGVRSRSGGAAPVRLVERPAIRSPRVAQEVARALNGLLTARATTGRLRIQGRPQVAVGDLVRLERFPEVGRLAGFDGRYLVTSVRHRLTKEAGLTTEIGFRSLPAPVGPGGGAS